ncbi:FAD-dependent monooxygenase [Acinetobacter baumannii]|uniref:FAD-dependent monooxygenase n=1 Tax=Acinetobacter baumannii TaxID=470 RepID=UPI0024481CF3|nr:FAD-dependent monooxygenase [Acinetobacter baumannii]MDH2566680.1 FAD-dependent monooxygenase [Acinetobacter baumannii]
MNIICSGAGPAGLYFSLLIKKAFPEWNVSLYEKSHARQTEGWGLILSQGLLQKMKLHDIDSFNVIKENMTHWNSICVTTPTAKIYSPDYSFLSLSRKKLIAVLQERCERLGVNIVYDHKFCLKKLETENYDLLIISEGLNSENRRSIFQAEININEKVGTNKYIWLGLEGDLGESFNFLFVETSFGYIWAHNYKFEDQLSTFVVEMSEFTWEKLGFNGLSPVESLYLCQKLFESYLKGQKLLLGENQQKNIFWHNYSEINCDTWSIGNIVLLGNAAHNTHFSIGSGTRLAMEDAIVLANNIIINGEINSKIIEKYEESRKNATFDLHKYSRNSMEWFENIPKHLIKTCPELFSKQLLNRAGKA